MKADVVFLLDCAVGLADDNFAIKQVCNTKVLVYLLSRVADVSILRQLIPIVCQPEFITMCTDAHHIFSGNEVRFTYHGNELPFTIETITVF